MPNSNYKRIHNHHKTYIGIDPGSKGAVVILRNGKVITHYLPKYPEDCLEIIRNLPRNAHILLEKIETNFFGISKHAACKIYGYYMCIKSFLLAEGYIFSELISRDWQKMISFRKEKGTKSALWKKQLMEYSAKLFPNVTVDLKNCDALLLAYIQAHM